jgi:Fe-S cluster assembly iron-binding protein IscA
MLQVTESAASVFREILDREDITGTAIRLAPVPGPGGETGITIQTVDGPEAGDAPSASPGLDVCVAPALAEPLDAAILDTQETDQGVTLVLRAQPGTRPG